MGLHSLGAGTGPGSLSLRAHAQLRCVDGVTKERVKEGFQDPLSQHAHQSCHMPGTYGRSRNYFFQDPLSQHAHHSCHMLGTCGCRRNYMKHVPVRTMALQGRRATAAVTATTKLRPRAEHATHPHSAIK